MGIGIWELLLIMVIVLLLFGTRKLRHIGADLGAAIKGFRDSLHEGETEAKPAHGPDRIEETKETERQYDEAKPEHPQRKPLEP